MAYKSNLRKWIVLLLIGTAVSCSDNEVTENEATAVDKVLEFYGGTCTRHKETLVKNGVKERHFILEMSESKLIESFSNRLELPASNIAYIFYSNLKDEKVNYSHVKVKINLMNDSIYEHTYKVEEIKEIESLIPILYRVSDLIKERNHEGLFKEFNTKPDSGITIEQLNADCYTYELKYGKVERVQFQGCRFYSRKTDNKPMVQLAGMMIRKRGNLAFSIFIERQSKKITDLKYRYLK
jgi:hypothetical protein